MKGPAEGRDEVALLTQHDPEAWEEMYRRLYPAMLHYAERRLGTQDEARDAVSEAMARAVAAVHRFTGRGEGPDAWIFGILRHVVIDSQRRSYRHRRNPRSRELDVSGDHGDALIVGEEHAAVRQAFDRLTDKEQELLELRIIAGLSSEEVAGVLGMRPGAVRMAQTRALARLRHLLEEPAGGAD